MFSLTDALSVKNTHLEAAHRFWGYFHIAAAAALGFAWGSDNANWALMLLLVLGFLLFSYGNRRLLLQSQHAAREAHKIISTYVNSQSASGNEKEFARLLTLDPPAERAVIGRYHLCMTAFIVTAILLRLPFLIWRCW